jgi:hypothetical protein
VDSRENFHIDTARARFGRLTSSEGQTMKAKKAAKKTTMKKKAGKKKKK